jgi:alkylation response protein AidB-like acyl-CoA dehydrogenase
VRSAIDQGDPRAFPIEAFQWLAGGGFLTLPLDRELGGFGLGREAGAAGALNELLSIVGWGDLSVARIYEGHINALLLIQQFGDAAQVDRAAGDAQRGLIFGVWNTEGADGLRVTTSGNGLRLAGGKTFASGAGSIERPLVTARDDTGGWQLIQLEMERSPSSVDRESWKTFGMRGSHSYVIDLSGARIEPSQLIGQNGDYYRQPWFSGGALRFCAAQLGGAAALLDLARDELVARGRAGDALQRHRIGKMSSALASGFAMLETAGHLADRSWFGGGPCTDDESFLAYVGLTRSTVERVCLEIIDTVEQALGTSALMSNHPVARIGADLRLYLRQPAPDAVLLGAAEHVLSTSEPFMRLWPTQGKCVG